MQFQERLLSADSVEKLFFHRRWKNSRRYKTRSALQATGGYMKELMWRCRTSWAIYEAKPGQILIASMSDRISPRLRFGVFQQNRPIPDTAVTLTYFSIRTSSPSAHARLTV